MPYKRIARYGLVIAVNLVLFSFLYRWYQQNIHWNELTAALRSVPISAILSVLFLGVAALGLYAKRLSYLLDQGAIGFWPSFWVISYGFGANNILPFRLGDVLKIYFARKNFGIAATRLLLVKVMEKFFDLSFLLLIGAWAVVIGGLAIQKVHLMIIATALAALFLGTFLAISFIRRDFAWIAKLRRFERIDNFITMFETVVSNPSLIKALVVTAWIWAATIGTMYLYYMMVLPDVNLRLTDVLALVFVTTLSLGIPSVPGALGLFEAAIVFYLNSFLKVPAAEALACALVLHLMLAAPQIFLMVGAMAAAKFKNINQATLRP